MQSVKERYRHFFNTELGIKQYQDYKKILYSPDDSLIQTLNNLVLQHIQYPQRKVLNICDIGGGDGRRISKIIRYLYNKFDFRFELDIIEQSKLCLNRFQLTNVDEIAKVNKVHDLFENATLSGGYDLVFLIHSIFAFDNGAALKKVLSLTNTGGYTIAVSNSPKSFLAGLKRLVDKDYEEPRYEIDALKSNLNALKIEFSEVSFITRWAIPPERYDEDINTILEEISLGSYGSFADSRKNEIIKYIGGKTDLQGTKRMFSEEEIILIIPPVNL